MGSPPVSEDGLFVASSFVHALLLVVSTFHFGFAHGSFPAVLPFRYDKHKHIVLSFRLAFALWLALVPLIELFYQFRWHMWPDIYQTLFYTEKVLTILAWTANLISTLFLAKTNKWEDFHPLDHLLQVLSWIFVMVIQSLRTAEYASAAMPSLTEQYTSVIVVTLGALYGVTVIAFVVVDLLRVKGLCLPRQDVSIEPVEVANPIASSA
ncbi:uncharacterized protein LOC129591968 [Paramacrobiotus metropolitanus]|uniref:uncharacterized protein LOC129591968 n=1 Tax=Paramacrobiotus metropolitanus TaxID=2943436 RepID=UPI002446427B|nr:uncharacterized protein LOC129591968 [Paramacrobiotus metropolitanus]XP_055343848.1 uncharacterized protein LOC129591968 [Paramacrobiotus metropolitanus]